MTDLEILNTSGYLILENVITPEQTGKLISLIDTSDKNRDTFRKRNDVFAIRQFLKEIPHAKDIIFSDLVKSLISSLFGNDYFIVKSIYFDKPGESNWFVSYHQDLTISVNQKADISRFGPWTVKQNQFAVQPPLQILQNNFTMRFHLDDTDENNGALKVIPGSHNKGLYRPETIDWQNEKEETCSIPAGGVMFMKPLLLHASGRTTNNKQRRVLHIEFSNTELPSPLLWSERLSIN